MLFETDHSTSPLRPDLSVELLYTLAVINPPSMPWIFAVEMTAVYDDPLFGQTASHCWDFRVPGDGGYFAAPPWEVSAIAVPDWTVVRWDGRVKTRGGKNWEVEALYSQSTFLNLSPLWRQASVGVVPAAVDWEVVAKVVVDVRNTSQSASLAGVSTFVFELLDVRGELVPPPARYFTYQFLPESVGTYRAEITYYDRDGTSRELPPVDGSAPWLELPPTAGT